MSKMIKLTDEIGGLLEKQAAKDHLSMAGEVAKLLSAGSGDLSSVIGKLDYLENHIDKKFSELKALIEDTAVDRVDGGGRGVPRIDIEWEIVQELIFEFLDEHSSEWLPGVYQAVHNMDDTPAACYTEDGFLWFEQPITGQKAKVLEVSPRVDQFLAEKIEGRIRNVA